MSPGSLVKVKREIIVTELYCNPFHDTNPSSPNLSPDMSIFITISPPSNEYSVSIKVQTRGIRSIYKKNFNTHEKIYNGKKKNIFSQPRSQERSRISSQRHLRLSPIRISAPSTGLSVTCSARDYTHTITRASRAIYNSYNRRFNER